MSRMTFIATGDAFITRRIPEDGYDGYEELCQCIRENDVKFTNLEMTFHDQEGVPAAVSGGTWAMAEPEILDDLKKMGFNLFNTANNHSCDYSHGGVLATISNLKKRNMVFSGTGKNLQDASRPCYLETKKGRVALISVCSTFDLSAMAGGQSGDLPGRPGLNPLRYTTRYHVDQSHYDMVNALARLTRINAARDHSVKNGYASPLEPGIMPLGKSLFVLDEKNWVESIPEEQDLVRITEEIKEAKRQADVVLVSIHAHESDTGETSVPARFIEIFSRACIDAGANVVIGHGPHEVRGIECYHNGVIFYSLGNFIFQTETVGLQPYDAYANKKMPIDTKVGAYMDARSKNGTAGYGVLPEIWNSVMASWTIEEGAVTQIRLYPVELYMNEKRTKKGIPHLTGDEQILEKLNKLCQPYNTQISIKNGVGVIERKKENSI